MMMFDITHSDFPSRRWASIRINTQDPIMAVKEKLFTHVGTEPEMMRVYLVDDVDTSAKYLLSDEVTLAEYTPLNGKHIHIENTGQKAFAYDEEAELQDKSTKFEITEEQYSKRSNSMRNFLMKMKQQKNATSTANADTNNSTDADVTTRTATTTTLSDTVANFPINSRCETQPGGLRGSVQFVGKRKSQNSKTIWIGVALDEPLGDTDGFECTEQVFQCSGTKYGKWCKPEDVKVGDFPAEDPFSEDS